MKFKTMLATGLAFFALSGSAFADCTFHWEHYGAQQTYNLIAKEIGTKISNEYCAKYNKTHEIVIITDEYSDTTRTLAHVSVGLRKRGSNIVPTKRMSAYRFENGNFVIGKKYEMAAATALDTVMDVMSDLDHEAN